MALAQYMLVLQVPLSDSWDFDAVVAFEKWIEGTLPSEADVDGHDFGAGESNVFVVTSAPRQAFAALKERMDELPRGLTVAYRPLRGSGYTVLWPEGRESFAVS